MVGTGRFELPNALVLANERPLARVLLRAFASRPRCTLGCSRSAASSALLEMKFCVEEKIGRDGQI